MSIITRRGDSGETDLLFGKRIAKTSLRVETLGHIDELNAALGLARAAAAGGEVTGVIDAIQQRLVGLMGQLACVPGDADRYRDSGFQSVGAPDVVWIESVAYGFEARGIRFADWARPGAEGSLARAGLDFARAVSRRAERSVLALHEAGEPVDLQIRLFFNRLSDVLWILARAEPA